MGGALCLDFANSIGGRGGNQPEECLFDYTDLVAWGRYAGVVNEVTAKRLVGMERQQPDDADAVFRHALDLREAIYCTFSATARGDTPQDSDLDLLHQAFINALGHARF
ncbi:MAG TPA: ABATE domain-containing protein, partial [Thermomicrobiales bacterium]|nr:ABATE domain-containing protein [Thermomicrobiales bacterium]